MKITLSHGMKILSLPESTIKRFVADAVANWEDKTKILRHFCSFNYAGLRDITAVVLLYPGREREADVVVKEEMEAIETSLRSTLIPDYDDWDRSAATWQAEQEESDDRMKPKETTMTEPVQAIVASEAIAAKHTVQTINRCVDFLNSLPPSGPNGPWCDFHHLHGELGNTIVGVVPNRSRHNPLPLQLLTAEEAAHLKSEIEKVQVEANRRKPKRNR